MRVLSLFDGIGSAYIALGSRVTEYISIEIDGYAWGIAHYHFECTRFGDINSVDFKQIGKVDLVVGGFPCQDLSQSNAYRSGLEGNRSGLYTYCLEALEICKPKYFIFENVASMNWRQRDKLTTEFGCKPIEIDTNCFTPQNRARLFWCNFAVDIPKEKCEKKLQDVLQSGEAISERAACLDASYYKGGSTNLKSHAGRRYMVRENESMRLLTPVECERIQGYPDNYTKYGKWGTSVFEVPKKYRYKGLGNAFSLPVIQHIVEHL